MSERDSLPYDILAVSVCSHFELAHAPSVNFYRIIKKIHMLLTISVNLHYNNKLHQH